MDAMMHKQFMCSTCSSKNSARYEKGRIRHIAYEIEYLVKNATEEQKEKQREIFRRNLFLKSMCEYNEHCKYGLGCGELSSEISNINHENEKLAENIVLLGIVDKDKLKYYLPSFQGYYPKAARYILSL